jgi:hypothetical protein
VSSYQSSSHNVASPILEIPEEIYQVRKAALQVLKPLTKTWVRWFFLSCSLHQEESENPLRLLLRAQ